MLDLQAELVVDAVDGGKLKPHLRHISHDQRMTLLLTCASYAAQLFASRTWWLCNHDCYHLLAIGVQAA